MTAGQYMPACRAQDRHYSRYIGSNGIISLRNRGVRLNNGGRPDCLWPGMYVEDMLLASRFMRVHRSYIVALDKITSIRKRKDLKLVIGNFIIEEGCYESFKRRD